MAGGWRGLTRQSRAPYPREPSIARAYCPPGPEAGAAPPPPRRPPDTRRAETARRTPSGCRTPSAGPTAAAGARRAPNCRPGPTNAGRGGEVRAAGGACKPLGGRRGKAARGEGRGQEAPKPSLNAAPGGAPLGGFAPFPLEGADGLTPHPE